MVDVITTLKAVFVVNQFLHNYKDTPLGYVALWLKSIVSKMGREWVEEAQFNRMKSLFGFAGKVGLYTSRDHPQWEGQVTPDSEKVIVELTRIIGSDKLDAQVEWVDIQTNDNMIALGGPVANIVTRNTMGYQKSGTEFSQLDTFPIVFPFIYDIFPKTRELVKRYAGGKLFREPKWGINAKENLFEPKITKWNWIEKDYLLITRMPNLLNKNAWEKRKAILTVGGTLGTGLRAFTILLKDANALKEMEKAVKRARYYQSLIEASDVVHSLQEKDSYATKVTHVHSQPIIVDNDKINNWFKLKTR